MTNLRYIGKVYPNEHVYTNLSTGYLLSDWRTKMLCCHKFFSKTQKLERSQLSHYATNMESNITVLKESLKNKSLIRQLNHAGMLIHIARYNVDNAKAILSWSKKNNGVLSESDINKIEKHIAGCEAYEQAQPYINL